MKSSKIEDAVKSKGLKSGIVYRVNRDGTEKYYIDVWSTKSPQQRLESNTLDGLKDQINAL